MTVSIIVPSRNEVFLQQTIQDLLANATGSIEILPILDGYEPPESEIVVDPRVRYIRLPAVKYTQMRHGINTGVEQASGEYVMKVDAHCLFEKGFDEVLVRDHQPNWVQTLRRDRLDAENWCIADDPRPPVDYEFLMFRPLINDKAIHGFKWEERGEARKDILIDDVLSFQGSLWFMTKDWYKARGLLQSEGYGGFVQEPEEIAFNTWKNDGACKVNKNAYYAHLHKGAKYGRMYWMSRDDNRKGYAYSYNKWVIEERAFFEKMIEKFLPMPLWPADWKKRIWG